MRGMAAILLCFIMLTPMLNFESEIADVDTSMNTIAQEKIQAVFIPSLEYFTQQESVEVIVLTNSITDLHYWQESNNLLPEQSEGTSIINFEHLDGIIQHRRIAMPGWLVAKLGGVDGVIAIHDSPGIPQPAGGEQGAEPNTVKSLEIHNATQAHNFGITGDGIKVAVVDSGVDFSHPDLNGTQARVDDSTSPWDGWPIAFDASSMSTWLSSGNAYPTTTSWYSDTSTTGNDSDGDGVIDGTSLDITGITSLSGVFHFGEHPDRDLRARAGGDVDVLVVDESTSGVYDTVYADLDRDGRFDDEQPMRKGSETSGLDTDGDGLWDRSGGMIYFIADGNTSLPYAPTFAARSGLADRIPGNGDLVMFMINEKSGPAGNHGTLCASAISAQGIANNGAVKGMAPNATIVAVANYYTTSASFDAWRFVAEGYDGVIDTGDEADIGSFSFGYSSVVDAGSDVSSMYLDWLTRVYSVNTTYLVALGNGGHGYGTVASPGGAPGVISVGAASSRDGGAGSTFGQVSSWSNRGPNSQGRLDPDIVAVGWSATGDTTLNEQVNANSATTTWSGTSLATPLAAGLTALVYEAFKEQTSRNPDSQEIRNLIMSTSTNLGYDPNVQGAGWFNAGKSVATILGKNNSWFTSPAAIMAGANDGQHRSANVNWLIPGQSSTHSITIKNPSNQNSLFQMLPTNQVPLDHHVYSWEVNSSNGWDGFQDSRPDKIYPVIIHNNTSQTIVSNNSTLLRARAAMSPLGFDGNQNYQSENRPYLRFLCWKDADSDGLYWQDLDNDSHVDSGELESSLEFAEFTAHMYASPQVEVRLGKPWEQDCDGILLAAYMENVRTSIIDPIPIEIDLTSFGNEQDSWISYPSGIGVPAKSSSTFNITISVPLNATPGLYSSQLFIWNTAMRSSAYAFPVLTTVAAPGPYSWSPPEIDGNVSNQSLYRETWMQGAQRWGWRAESGDWKAFALDWPANLSDGSIIIDVDWPDSGYGDIDAHWLSRTTHPYASESPDYGQWGMLVEKSSANGHRGSGVWTRDSNTGADREILVAPATPGLKQLLLHSTMHGVNTNDNPVNVTVGYAGVIEGALSHTISNWSNADFNSSIVIASDVELDIDDVESFGWARPIWQPNEVVQQDTAGTVSSSSYSREFNLEDAQRIMVEIDSNGARDDLDLYVYRDADNDGLIDWSSEEEGRSGNWNSDEEVIIDNPQDGRWFVAVHGYDVPAGNTTFWLKVTIVAGDEVEVVDWREIPQSEILTRWANGSSRLAGMIPANAWELNLSITRPEDTGQWQGMLDMPLSIGGSLEIPLHYDLKEQAPVITFTKPLNGSHHSDATRIHAHAWDLGGGFNLSQVNWSGPLLNATISGWLLNGTQVNLTSNFTQENYTLNRLWINASLPQNNSVHSWSLQITDLSNRTSFAQVFAIHDSLSPLIIRHAPISTLTNQTSVDLSLVAEEYLNLRIGAMMMTPSNSASGYWESTASTGRAMWYNKTLQLVKEGENNFEISALDRAGNHIYANFSITRDTTEPFIELELVNPVSISNTSEVEVRYRSEPNAQLWLDNQSVSPSTDWTYQTFNMSEGIIEVNLRAMDEAGNHARRNISLEIDLTPPHLAFISPIDNATLWHHLIDLRWENPGEEVETMITLNSNQVAYQGDDRVVMLELLTTGEHEICISLRDNAQNKVTDCIEVYLSESQYTGEYLAPWHAQWVNQSQVEFHYRIGSGQDWQFNHLSGGEVDQLFQGIGDGEWNSLTLELEEGENFFEWSWQGRGLSQTVELNVNLDSIVPWIELDEGAERVVIPNGSAIQISGVAEPGLEVKCNDIDSFTESTILQNGSFAIELDVFGTWDVELIDGLSYTAKCSVSDVAGNSASAQQSILLDATAPIATMELFEQSSSIFTSWDIRGNEDLKSWEITIKHDGIVVQYLSSSTNEELVGQRRISTDLAGSWNLSATLLDNAGNQRHIETGFVIEPVSEDGLLNDIGEMTMVNVGLAVVVVGLLLLILLRSKRPKQPLDAQTSSQYHQRWE